MNQATKSTYQNDLVFQGLFYFPMLLMYLIGFLEPGGFIIGALTQFFVGVVQVLSGAFHSVKYESQAHKRYFMIAIGYVLFLILGSVFLSNTSFNFGIASTAIIILFVFIIPVSIATWYYRLTWLAYKNAAIFAGQNNSYKPLQEDILDDAML